MRYFNEEERIAREKKVYNTSHLPPNHAWYVNGVQEKWQQTRLLSLLSVVYLVYGIKIILVYWNSNIRMLRDITGEMWFGVEKNMSFVL